MRKLLVIFVALFCLAGLCFAQENKLLLDNFQGAISGGPDGTVDFGAGNGSSVEVSAAKEIKHSGEQSLKAVFNAVSGGYIWIARGFGLDAKNSAWLVKPQDINWKKYKAVSFYLYGSDSKAKIAFDIKDSGGEIWRFLAEDNFQGWKQVVCLFEQFYARTDWQPDSADKNGVLDFPLQSFQFEPLPEANGTLYFADVELIPA